MVDQWVSLGIDRRADTPAEIGEDLDVLEVDDLIVLRYQKEPVAPPSNVTDHLADSGNTHGEPARRAVAHHIGNADLTIRTQARLHSPNRRVELERTCGEIARVLERSDYPDRAMPAHTQ